MELFEGSPWCLSNDSTSAFSEEIWIGWLSTWWGLTGVPEENYGAEMVSPAKARPVDAEPLKFVDELVVFDEYSVRLPWNYC